MEIALLIFAILCAVIGVAGCILPALPGPPLTYAGLLFLHWSGYVHFSTTALIVWGLVMVVVTVVDFFITPVMTRKFGGSKAGGWGALIGMFVGFFIAFPIGPLLGPFIGALIGEKMFCKKDTASAIHAAFGAFLSFFVGIGIKLFVCMGMIIHAIYLVF